MTSSNGNIFRVTGICAGNSPANSPHKSQWHGALMFSLICALNKQTWGWWFETPSRHCDGPHRSSLCIKTNCSISRHGYVIITHNIMRHVTLTLNGSNFEIALHKSLLGRLDKSPKAKKKKKHIKKQTFVQVMAWCCQATSNYPSRCWPRFEWLHAVILYGYSYLSMPQMECWWIWSAKENIDLVFF